MEFEPFSKNSIEPKNSPSGVELLHFPYRFCPKTKIQKVLSVVCAAIIFFLRTQICGFFNLIEFLLNMSNYPLHVPERELLTNASPQYEFASISYIYIFIFSVFHFHAKFLFGLKELTRNADNHCRFRTISRPSPIFPGPVLSPFSVINQLKKLLYFL